jgi:hypothetical protein
MRRRRRRRLRPDAVSERVASEGFGFREGSGGWSKRGSPRLRESRNGSRRRLRFSPAVRRFGQRGSLRCAGRGGGLCGGLLAVGTPGGADRTLRRRVRADRGERRELWFSADPGGGEDERHARSFQPASSKRGAVREHRGALRKNGRRATRPRPCPDPRGTAQAFTAWTGPTGTGDGIRRPAVPAHPAGDGPAEAWAIVSLGHWGLAATPAPILRLGGRGVRGHVLVRVRFGAGLRRGRAAAEPRGDTYESMSPRAAAD